MKIWNQTFTLIAFVSLFATTGLHAQSRLEAKMYAQNTAEKLMKSISPNTGNNASATVVDYDWDYAGQRYVIEMQATWRGGRCWLCDEEAFVIKGILRVGKDGRKPDFKYTYRNAAVRGAWTDQDVGNAISGAAILISAFSDN